MNLYLKYRPTEFDQIVGNAEVVESITNMMEKDPPHSILLTGPTGCGKTTIGRIIVGKLGCKGVDFTEVDSADFRGIETVRNIRKLTRYSPVEGDARVFLIDECHKMTNDAQNALLKILEDTPAHVYFILCTTDPQKLLKTVKGRCITFDLNILSDTQMKILVKRVVKAEEESIEPEVYRQIISGAKGHPRNALQILDQVLAVDPENRLETAKRAEVLESVSVDLCKALIKGAGWKEIAGTVKGLKDQDSESIRRHVLAYTAAVALNGKDPERMGLILEAFSEPYYNTNFSGLVLSCLSVVYN